MNYRELLQKYKAGELPEEQRKQVRQDIEKQDAISEYLFDNEEMEFEEQVEQDGGRTTESTDGSVPKDGQNVNIVGAAVPKDGQRTMSWRAQCQKMDRELMSWRARCQKTDRRQSLLS